MKIVMRMCLLWIFVWATLPAEDNSYQLGHGMKLGTLPLYVGGYFSLEYEDLSHGGRSLKLDDISVMLYGEHENIAYMMEFEANDIYTESLSGPEASEVVNDHFHIERFYLDYTFNDNYMIRAGKYNSPIGLWNLIPINVLRDTTSNPVISTELFPQFTSGVDVKYSSNDLSMLTIDVMMQENEDLDVLISDEIYNNFDVDRHYGIGISGQNDALDYRVNAGYFRLVTGEQYYYLSGAVHYTYENLAIQTELGTQFDDDGTLIPYVGYVQGSYTIKDKHEAILRVESYDDRKTNIQDTFAVFAYTYRPLYPIAIKGEYQWHSWHEDNQFLLSLSVLF